MEFREFKDVKTGVKRYFAALDLRGRTVVDVPAGDGGMTRFLRSREANVVALDLFTHGTLAGDVTIHKADLTGTLPLPDACADYVLCQEGIEHLADHHSCLMELSRIVKPDGRLILTTPNFSSLRARFYGFFLETNSPRHLPPNETDDVWFGEHGDICFGHMFPLGIQRMRVLARVSGLRIRRIHPTAVSGTSLLLFFLAYPFIALIHVLAFRRSKRRRGGAPTTGRSAKEEVLREIRRIGLNPVILISNHLFVEFEKCPVVRHRTVETQG